MAEKTIFWTCPECGYEAADANERDRHLEMEHDETFDDEAE